MNSKNIVPVSTEKENCTCMMCMREFPSLNVFHFHEMGYASMFDGVNTEVHLCDECWEKVKHLMTHEIVVDGNGFETYKHEEELEKLFESWSLESRELLWNRFAHGPSVARFEPQDYIDLMLDEFSDEQCKKYGMYTNTERRIYEERFSTCALPMNIVYKDGSVGCWCPCGASGRVGQIPASSVCIQCIKCPHYLKRDSDKNPIKNISREEYEKYKEIFSAMKTFGCTDIDAFAEKIKVQTEEIKKFLLNQ